MSVTIMKVRPESGRIQRKCSRGIGKKCNQVSHNEFKELNEEIVFLFVCVCVIKDYRIEASLLEWQEAVKWELAELKNERRGKRQLCLGSQDSVARLSRGNRQCGKHTAEQERCCPERWLWLTALGTGEVLAGTREEMRDREGGSGVLVGP